jgi:DNA-binding CsgD family transcriptional regulator
VNRRPAVDRRREQTLLASSERIAGMGSWKWTPATGELEWTENLFRIFGLEPGEVEPSVDLVIGFVHPSDRDRVVMALSKAREKGDLPPLDYRIIRSDRSVRYLRANAAHLGDDGGGHFEVAGSIQDVTDQLRAEREIALHSSVSRVLADWESLATGGVELLRGITQAMEFDSSVLWIPRGELLLAVLFWHEPSLDLQEFEDVTRRTHFPRGVGVPGRVWETGEVIKRPDTPEVSSRERRRAAEAAGMIAALGVPATRDREVLAVLEFCCREPHELTDRFRESLIGVGHQIGQFLDHRRGELLPSLLTPRETEILQLAANGKSGPDIAAELTISVSTVKAHFEHVHQKLGVNDRASAVANALRLGLIS